MTDRQRAAALERGSATSHREIVLTPLTCLAMACSGPSAQATVADAGVDEHVVRTPDAACAAELAASAASCAGDDAGATTCGPCEESCCASLFLPAGTYQRSYESSEGGPDAEAHPATLSGVYLDKYEVTVGRFRRFVAAWGSGTGWMPSAGAGKHSALNHGNGLNAIGGGYEPGWTAADNASISPTDAHLACYSGTWTPAAGGQERLPINCVNWYEAYAFCIWDGGFLPSEAESEYAAAGGSEQRLYPWGSTDPGMSSEYEIYDCDYPTGHGPCAGAGNLAPVGTPALGSGRWGQVDLAGNVEEWGLDWYEVPYSDPCTDCAYLTVTTRRILRGGNFFEFASATLASYRDASPPATRSAYYGIRCAREAL